MVQINISNGQGITQAIRDKIGAKNIKNADLGTWQKVMTEVNNAQKKDSSIFKTGENYTTDASKIGDKSTNHTNFVVDAGTVEIDDGIWNKIKDFLTGAKESSATTEQTPADKSKVQENTQDVLTLVKKAEPEKTKPQVVAGKLLDRSVDGDKQQIAVVKQDGKNVRYAVNEDGTLGDTLAATKTFGKNKYISGDFPPETRILEREVNGKKQQIGFYKDENGNQVHKLVTTDDKTGKTTLGENLVTISTAGKNKYITQTEMDKMTSNVFPEGMPKGVTAGFVTIGGEPQLVFKKDGKTLDQPQLRELVKSTDKKNKTLNTTPKTTETKVEDLKFNDITYADLPRTAKGRYIVNGKAYAKDIKKSIINNKIYKFKKEFTEEHAKYKELKEKSPAQLTDKEKGFMLEHEMALRHYKEKGFLRD